MAAIYHYLGINKNPKIVYDAVTTSEGIVNWWTTEAIVKPEINSIAEFKFGDKYHNKMKITNLLENKLIEWECLEGDEEWMGTKFSFELKDKGEKSILKFKQYNWREETEFFASCNFHWGFYLQSLKDYCETGKGTPHQRRKY